MNDVAAATRPDPAMVRRLGQGPRPALMIHCSLAHSGEWSALAERLGDRLHMVAFDLPGHGRAPDWQPGSDIAAVALESAVPLAEAEDGPVDLVGHSFGAVVALRLALERPDLVRTLTLIEPTLFAAARAAGAPEAVGHEDEMRPLQAALEAGDAEGAARMFIADWGTGQSWEATPEAQRRYFAERIHLILASEPVLWHDSGNLLAPGRLEGLEMPVLLLEGGDSPPIITAIARELARRLKRVTRVTVPGATHMLPVTHPDAVAAAIGVHLTRG
ncbi:alpha/beta fold hydrolase [Acidimangrovimonas pyrenivorans]|uniref:Alpha/beta fold hydrolase n=1 Tax=Acidimangrovimonas pyrenivorans TaxID=2030798 RepID=A0ABV7AKZ4_9RHOB